LHSLIDYSNISFYLLFITQHFSEFCKRVFPHFSEKKTLFCPLVWYIVKQLLFTLVLVNNWQLYIETYLIQNRMKWHQHTAIHSVLQRFHAGAKSAKEYVWKLIQFLVHTMLEGEQRPTVFSVHIIKARPLKWSLHHRKLWQMWMKGHFWLTFVTAQNNLLCCELSIKEVCWILNSFTSLLVTGDT